MDLRKNTVIVGEKEFAFGLSKIEKELIGLGGITPAFMKFGKDLFQGLCSSRHNSGAGNGIKAGGCSSGKLLEW